jgi:anti-sigma regulatory factor (Ser/Thr protein kinase)
MAPARPACAPAPASRTFIDIDARAVAAARSLVRSMGCGQHCAATIGSAELIASELVTNAIRHGAPPVILEITCDGETVQVGVSDTSPDLPALRQAGDDDEDGRGLRIVDVLSDSHGVDVLESHKTVWARIAARP